jgi:hypothetical protein
MEPEGSLPNSEVPASCPYPEPNQSNPCLPSHFVKNHLNIILLSKPGSSKWPLSLRFPHQNPAYTPTLRHTFYVIEKSASFLFKSSENTKEKILKLYVIKLK